MTRAESARETARTGLEREAGRQRRPRRLRRLKQPAYSAAVYSCCRALAARATPPPFSFARWRGAPRARLALAGRNQLILLCNKAQQKIRYSRYVPARGTAFVPDFSLARFLRDFAACLAVTAAIHTLDTCALRSKRLRFTADL